MKQYCVRLLELEGALDNDCMSNSNREIDSFIIGEWDEIHAGMTDWVRDLEGI